MNTMYNDELAVRRLHDDVLTSFNNLDLEKLLSLHTDDIILMDPNMPTIHGKQQVRQLFTKFQQQNIVLQLSFTMDEVVVFGDRAFVRGRVMKTTMQHGVESETETGRFVTLSQKKADGRWLRTHVMANSDMPLEKQDAFLQSHAFACGEEQ